MIDEQMSEPTPDERKDRLRLALDVVRGIAWPDWTPSRSHPTPPWENPHYASRLGYTRIAKAFVDAGWTPPIEQPKIRQADER